MLITNVKLRPYCQALHNDIVWKRNRNYNLYGKAVHGISKSSYEYLCRQSNVYSTTLYTILTYGDIPLIVVCGYYVPLYCIESCTVIY